MSAAESAAINTAIASGGPIPYEPGFTGPPPGTYIPTPQPPVVQSPSPTPSPIKVFPIRQRFSPAIAPVSNTPAPVTQPVQMVQPANAPQPVDTTAPASMGFFSTTILGIPIWIWGVGALGAFFALGGQHGR